ncbi:unnamed protein product [Musa acuminata var. zebrina]
MVRPFEPFSSDDASDFAPSLFTVLFSDFLVSYFFFIAGFVIVSIIFFFYKATLKHRERKRKWSAVATMLARIPRSLYVVSSSSSSSSSSTTSVSVIVPEPDVQSCVICLEEFVNGEELWMLPRCKHLFHGVCIKPWLLVPSATCPVCRKLVTQGETSGAGSRNNSNNYDDTYLFYMR